MKTLTKSDNSNHNNSMTYKITLRDLYETIPETKIVMMRKGVFYLKLLGKHWRGCLQVYAYKQYLAGDV